VCACVCYNDGHVCACDFYDDVCVGLPEPYTYGAYTVFWAGKSPDTRSYTVYIYTSGQSYVCMCV